MNNDLISREALKEEFLKYKPYAVDFLSLIDNAPTVEPDRPQGEWIVYDRDEPIKFCKCSLCGRYEEIINFKNYPYCHCGAVMKGGME